MSEAELHILRQRMRQGRLNKAKRGELFNHAPIGYVRRPTGEVALDPDEQVRAVVRLIFDQFDELGTINAVLQYLVRHAISLPVRPHAGANRGQLEWRRPNRQTLRNLLHHPLYAGAYTWGRRAVDPRRKVPGRPYTGRTVVPAEQCMVFLKDHCPAYIGWQRYKANQQRIADNQARAQRRGAAREGSALLQGLLICGRCGSRMLVQYRGGRTRTDDRDRLCYACCRHAIEYGQPRCQSLCGAVLDAFVARQVLAVLEPAVLDLSLSACQDVERQRVKIDRHWQHRLERARYQADRAARQYHAVEPENRLVVRELERQWEQRLSDQRELEEQYDRFCGQHRPKLTEADRQRIRDLCHDIPKLWHDPQTSWADRKTLVRHLIDRILVVVVDDSQHVDLTVHWAGGFTSQHALIRPVARYEQLDNYDQFIRRIGELRDEKKTLAQIAEQLNTEGYRPPKRRQTFNAGMIRQLLWRCRRPGKPPPAVASAALGEHEWWFADLAYHLQMPHPTLYSWLHRGWVHARQLPGSRGRWVLWADKDELDRLRQLRSARRSWLNRPQAALTQPKERLSTR